jgi:SAM-dependent methyltransferase
MRKTKLRYSDITFEYPSPNKRYVQRKRLTDALSVLGECFTGSVLDYGGGNGELTRMIAERFPNAQVVCYEPAPEMFTEAKENLDGLGNVVLASSPEDLRGARFDYVFCLEVFEHLPRGPTLTAIRTINRLLRTSGVLIVGVPNELYIMALLKGAFRMRRRYGAYGARPSNVLRAAIGKPPTDRPRKRLGPGLPYHPHHLGFDHRRLRAQLCETFEMVRSFGSPFGRAGELLNSEIIFVMRNRPRKPR